MSRKYIYNFLLLLSSSLLMVSSVHAQWMLDNEESLLSFVTIKADNVGEVHSFDNISGIISDAGRMELVIELASVNTLIPIRNERMLEMLFETNLFPRAQISGQVDIASAVALNVGESRVLPVNFSLSLHGKTIDLSAEVIVIRSAAGIIVSTLKPMIVTADSFDLVAGVERLREVAGLTRISNAVPVSFTATFRPQ